MSCYADSNLDANCNGTLGNYTSLATANDACSPVTVTQSPAIGSSVSGIGNIIMTLTARDASNNTNSCSFTVTKVDVTAPVITVCASNQNVNLNNYCKISVPNLVPSVTATDNCTVTVTQSPTAGTLLSSSHNQAHVVTITATDAAGNTATCSATLTAKDVTAPVINVCAPDQNVNLNNYCKISVPNLIPSVNATDNCTVTVTQSPTAGTLVSSSHNQTHVVTITATDAAGNTATCSATLTAKDVIAPVISVCAPAQNVNLDVNCKISVPNLVLSVTASDNCTVTVYTKSNSRNLIKLIT
jgi:hypothetical protein